MSNKSLDESLDEILEESLEEILDEDSGIIKIDLEDNVMKDLIEIYINLNMTKESMLVFNENVDNHGMMHAAALALRNEAIIEAVKQGIEHEKQKKAAEEE